MSDRFHEQTVKNLRDGLNSVMTSHNRHILNDSLSRQVELIEEDIGDIELEIRVTIRRVFTEQEKQMRDAVAEDREERRQRGGD